MECRHFRDWRSKKVHFLRTFLDPPKKIGKWQTFCPFIFEGLVRKRGQNGTPYFSIRVEIGFTLVNSSYLLTKNSVEEKKKQRIEGTLERYRNFVTQFPNTQYKKDVNFISDTMEEELQEFNSKKKI